MRESVVPVKAPSEILAEKIAGLLLAKKLVLPGDVQKISTNLAFGKLKAEDWRMAIEKVIDKEVADE